MQIVPHAVVVFSNKGVWLARNATVCFARQLVTGPEVSSRAEAIAASRGLSLIKTSKAVVARRVPERFCWAGSRWRAEATIVTVVASEAVAVVVSVSAP